MKIKWRLLSIVLVAAVGFTPVSCGSVGDSAGGAGARVDGRAPGSDALSPSRTPVDPARVRANELGDVPVLMIHQVAPGATGDYGQTPAQFEATLEWLARQRYVPVTAAELVTGRLDLPAGTSPVVLTFDDGYADQLQLRPDGTVDPQCAVGVVLAVAARHPGFRPVGTMYVNGDPFGGDSARKLRWLVEHGWEVGNHTLSHANLRALDAAGVQRELVLGEQAITRAVPGYRVTTMALPLGAMPRDPALAHRGAWNGARYDYRGVMLVGAEPAKSPFHAEWDPFGIPRLRSWGGRTSHDAHYWLPRIATTRYVSDGNPDTISFPRSAGSFLAPPQYAHARPY